MCEINKHNFKEKLPEIKCAIDNSKFISIDLEFSALNPLKSEYPSLFDSSPERYLKIKHNLENVIPVQIGLTTFSFDVDKNLFEGTVYNIFVKPASFPGNLSHFYFQSESIDFLTMFNFNFNKFAYDAVPYISKQVESNIRKKLKNNEITEAQSSFKFIIEEILENEGDVLKNWYNKAKVGDELSIPSIYNKCNGNYEILYFVQKSIQSRFKCVWTSVNNKNFIVMKVNDIEFSLLQKNNNVEDNLILDIFGFTEIFQYLVKSRKPIIGHNIFQDLILMINSFNGELPNNYNEFKKLVNKLFPTVYDTKTISYEIKNLIPEEKRYNETSLSYLFEYFKNGTGRHLALNSPAIDIKTDCEQGNFHEAGWDSFCSGYIFIRFAYFDIYQKYPSSKTYVSSELLSAMSKFKNKINVIRGYTSHINLEGEDPKSNRPGWLVIESNTNKPINLTQVTSLLSSYGFVEIKRLSFINNRALVAVDNFGNARRILNTFKTNNDFKIKQYNVFKHSPVVRAFVVSGITISGAILLWLTHTITR